MPDNSFCRHGNGRVAFEMFKVPADSYRAICDDLIASFQLRPVGVPACDFVNVVFQDDRHGSQVVSLEWDRWSGFIVAAQAPDAEPLVQAIAEWLLNSQWATVSDSAGPSASAAVSPDARS